MDKPFPWTCYHCLTESVEPCQQSYSYTVGTGENAKTYFHKEVYIPTCTRCGALHLDIKTDEELRRRELEM